jgi:hypothetical protein
MATRTAPTAWAGAIVFGACVMVVLGTFNVIQGLYAIFEDEFYTIADGQVLLVDLTVWGWVFLIFGVIQVLAGWQLMKGATWARVVVMVLVGLNAASQMLFLPAYPLWSILIIALDMLVLWAVTFHGAEMREE